MPEWEGRQADPLISAVSGHGDIVSSVRLELAKRPDAGGNQGVHVNGRSNYLNMVLDDIGDFYQYDVTVTNYQANRPARKPSTNRAINRLAFEEWQRQQQQDGGVLAPIQPGGMFGWCLYDGQKILYCNREMAIDVEGREFIVGGVREEGEPEPSTFAIKIKKTATIFVDLLRDFYQWMRTFSADPNPPTPRPPTPSAEVLAAIEFLVRQYPSLAESPVVAVNRSFYAPDTRRDVQRSVLQMMQGVYGSVRFTSQDGGVAINIDVSHGVFYPAGPFLGIICRFLNVGNVPQTFSEQFRRMITMKFRNVFFSVTHRGKAKGRHRLTGLTSTDAITTEFRDQHGNSIRVVDYFATTYNIILQYPRLPLIEVRTAGGKGPRYFPIELCNIIPNQRFSGRVNEDETTALVQFASTAPPQKEHSLQQIHGKMRFSRAQNPYLDAYGADVRTQMVTIQARKLQDPEMLYFGKSGNPVVTGPANKGFWNMPNNAVFVQPGQLKGLSIAVFADNRALSMNNDPFAACTNIQAFVAELLRVSDDLGLRMERDVTIPEPRYLDPNSNFAKDLADIHEMQHGANLMIVILPTDNAKNPVYNDIKRVTDTIIGVASQCIKPKWIRGMDSNIGGGGGGNRGGRPPKRTDRSLFTQVALKVNVKLDGINVMTREPLPIIDEEPAMILGIDATHPPPGSHSLSIASVVASVNRTCTLYRATTAILPNRAETVEKLGNITYDYIRLFQMYNNRALPQKIIAYRDGVSEGQFETILGSEVAQIKTAAKRISTERVKMGRTPYDPKVTFVVTQKRHHSRFFFDHNNTDRKGNALPGTVIDSGIVHPDNYEFYLYSHAGLQGTSRPTKYQVLYDDNLLSSNSLQQLTYHLCHLYARSMRSVSIPPPVYYAHLVAERARSYLKDESDAGSISSGGRSVRTREEVSLAQVKRGLVESGLWFI